MRIVSRFHDYYDSVQKYGQDLSLLYIRKQEILEIDQHHPNFYIGHLGSNFPPKINARIFNVAFCGKLYHGIKLIFNDYPFGSGDIVKYCYSVKDCFDFLSLYRIPSTYTYKNEMRDYSLNESHLKQYFEKNEETNLNIILSCPIILRAAAEVYNFNVEPKYTYDYLFLKNPFLKRLEFFRAVETNQAYQQLQSFLSGVLRAEEPKIIKVSDNTRLIKHGFDNWSFRKLPTKKKRK